MREIFYLTKRNCLIYLRDRAAVFFSMMSMLIILGLMVVFLGKTHSEDLVTLLAKFGERDAASDERGATYVIQLWTLAGILSVNSITVTMSVLSAMVQDEARKRIMAFYVAPVKRTKLFFGYALSAWLIGTVMCTLTLAAGEIYFRTQGYPPLPLSVFLRLMAIIALNTFTFSALGYLLALLARSDGAWSSMMTILGTLAGFAGGIYLPLGALGETLQSLLKCLPVLHGASMMRQACMDAAVTELFAGLPAAAKLHFREKMGITLFWNEKQLLPFMQVIILLVYAIIATIAAALLNKKRKLKDR